MHSRTTIRLLIASFLLAGQTLMGCESSWERTYRLSEVAPARPAGSTVVLREVPWERLQGTLGDLHARRVSSDVHPDEWTAEQKQEAKATLLRGLQVSGDPSEVTILGRSEFRTTLPTRPDDGELESFARKMGATMVVWSSTYLGKVRTTVQEPVTSYSTGSDYGRGRDGRRRSSTYTENSTIWVPVSVDADEHAWAAYLLRVDAQAMDDAR